MIKVKTMTNGFKRFCAMLFTLCGLLSGCTSLGYETRSIPKFAKSTDKIVEVGFDGDDNELSVAIEKLLEDRGVKVKILSRPKVREQRGDKEYTYDEVQTRYILRVRSVDLDTCIPEGSRQMHFNVSVVDFQERNRVFLMSDEFGCKDTLLRNFESWLTKVTSTRSSR
jgi:CRISPR/Cas system-associated protein Cas5 (RAMP superfamily)